APGTLQNNDVYLAPSTALSSSVGAVDVAAGLTEDISRNMEVGIVVEPVERPNTRSRAKDRASMWDDATGSSAGIVNMPSGASSLSFILSAELLKLKKISLPGQQRRETISIALEIPNYLKAHGT
ncbi:MAG: hypothetical protein MHPSP_004037, partial [Paramarteilia canceri]